MNHSTVNPTTIDRTDQQARKWAVGNEIHGFADGFFGRDSYGCRVIEAVGEDWIITRNRRNEVEHISIADANQIVDPTCPSFCLNDEDQGPCDIKSTLESGRWLRSLTDD